LTGIRSRVTLRSQPGPAYSTIHVLLTTWRRCTSGPHPSGRKVKKRRTSDSCGCRPRQSLPSRPVNSILPCLKYSHPTPQMDLPLTDEMRNNFTKLEILFEKRSWRPGRNLSSVALTALFLLRGMATVVDRATWCSCAKGLTGCMAAGMNVASEMETNGALRSARQQKQSAINSATILLTATHHGRCFGTCCLSISPSPCRFGSANSTAGLQNWPLLPSSIIRLSSLHLSSR